MKKEKRIALALTAAMLLVPYGAGVQAADDGSAEGQAARVASGAADGTAQVKGKAVGNDMEKSDMSWNKETLQAIDKADDLKIAPFRADGKTTGTPTWIWEVVVDGRLFVRAYNGKRSSWYQAAIAQKGGKIVAIGKDFPVRFQGIDDEALNARIDDAYRSKYASSRYMQHMIGTGARAATVEIIPAE